MILNDAGIMFHKWYLEMGNKYPNIKCCDYVIMPNNFHCIIEITELPRKPDNQTCGDPLLLDRGHQSLSNRG